MPHCARSPLPEACHKDRQRWRRAAVGALALLCCVGVDAQNSSFCDSSCQRQRDQSDAAARRNQEIERANRSAPQSQGQPSSSGRTAEDIRRQAEATIEAQNASIAAAARDAAAAREAAAAADRDAVRRFLPQIEQRIAKLDQALAPSGPNCSELKQLGPPFQYSTWPDELAPLHRCEMACRALENASLAMCAADSGPLAARRDKLGSARLLVNEDRLFAEAPASCGCKGKLPLIREHLKKRLEWSDMHRAEIDVAEQEKAAAEKQRAIALERQYKSENDRRRLAELQQRVDGLYQAALQGTFSRPPLGQSGVDQLIGFGAIVREFQELSPRWSPEAEYVLSEFAQDPKEKAAAYQRIADNRAGYANGSFLALQSWAFAKLGNFEAAVATAEKALPSLPEETATGISKRRLEHDLKAFRVILAGGNDVVTQDARRALAADIRMALGKDLEDKSFTALRDLDHDRLMEVIEERAAALHAFMERRDPANARQSKACNAASWNGCQILIEQRTKSAAAAVSLGQAHCANGLGRACDDLYLNEKYRNPLRAFGYLVTACDRSGAFWCGHLSDGLREIQRGRKIVDVESWSRRGTEIANVSGSLDSFGYPSWPTVTNIR